MAVVKVGTIQLLVTWCMCVHSNKGEGIHVIVAMCTTIYYILCLVERKT